ncbi:NAD(P)/FAD-dependent oxidoreductase [Microbacterium sp. zg.B185]|uniref:NAD(P)/FAD-dependent oxidoreductase n=2 Tax=unclassified Microbacterium TaxID=2609290 RepID=UPI00214ADD87|nr:NAD(P)/FAD-dependent oxidoreductase [Microbacterium sp. zg.B185]
MKSQNRCGRNQRGEIMYDTIVIGGGPAGLQAALTLGRMHRQVLLLDSGEYRNGMVEHAQNLITHDGRPPAQLRALARADIAAYDTVEIRDAAAQAVAPAAGGFVVDVEGAAVGTRTVLLATGLRDELPAIPGLAAVWGRGAASCPFCHGHELSGKRIAILGGGAHADMQSAMLGRIASELVVLEPAEVAAVEPAATGLTLRLSDGSLLEVGGVFLAPTATQRAPFAAQLGVRMLESGCVAIDLMGHTSMPGVFAAGDMAHSPDAPGPLASLAAATSAGQLAAVGCVRMLIAAEPG